MRKDGGERRVLILDGSIWEGAYNPAEGWRRYLEGVPAESVHLPAGERVPALGGFTHLILTGSEASITTPEPWFEAEAAVVRAATAAGMPILASCFGHQMLARTLSGPEHVRACPHPEIGWIEIEFLAADPLLAGVPPRASCFASHFDEVVDPPAPWRVLARTEACPVQLMRWGEKPIWGLQPHPEITPAEARPLLETGMEKMPEAASLFRTALEQPPRDDEFAHRLTANFLRSG